ncbi:MAG: hypothetical protein Q9157_004187 [Trypethelium eluteriae]
MARIEGFLDAMSQLGEMVDRFLNSTPFMGYVWVGFTLENTTDMIDEIFPGTYQVLATGWKRFFQSSWKSFDAQFRRILDSLGRHKEWIESEKSTAAILEAQAVRELAEARFLEISQLEKRKQLSAVMEKLSPPDFQLDHDIATEQKKGSSTGQWISEDPKFLAWSEEQSWANPLLYIYGVPGAGKTILASTVINKLMNRKSPVLYFYCKHQHEQNTFGDILRALLAQSIGQDSSSLSYIYEVCSTKNRVMMTAMLEELVDVAFASQSVSFIVLDGLDECTSEEAEKAISWFVSRCKKQESLDSGRIRLACVGQRIEILQRLLSSAEEICLENEQHQQDIFTYVKRRAHDLTDEFEIDSQTESSIVKRTTESAKSMFLFAKLVMENLSNQLSRNELLKEIDRELFPVDLKDAYDRIVANLLKVGPQRRAAMQIIEAVTCAFRPLKWREIQAFFFIDPKTSDCDYQGRKLRKSCKKLCSSLIDLCKEDNQLDGDATLTLVHESARHYLIKKGLLEISQGHAKMGLFCAAYLTSLPFNLASSEDDLTKWILAGYFAFHEYAVTYTVEHIIATIDEHRDCPEATRDDIEACLKNFIDAYAIPDDRAILHESGGSSGLATVLRNMHPTARARSKCFDLEQRNLRIREKIRSLACDSYLDETCEHRVRELYGLQNFKCPKIGCYYFLTGFVSDATRRTHLDRHDRPFTCTERDCAFAKFGFEDQRQLEGHLRHHHNSRSSEMFISRKRPKTVYHDVFYAASQGDVSSVETFLNDGNYVDVTDKAGDSLLIHAVQNSQLQICKMLVKNGANINRITSQKKSALSEAVHAQGLEVLQYLLSLDGIVTTARVGNSKRTAFGEAVHMSSTAKAMLFVDSGKLDWSSTEPDSPFRVALVHSCPAILQRLLERSPKDIAINQDLLWHATRYRTENPEKKVKLLLETGRFDIDRVCLGRTPLQMATRAGQVAVVDQLLATNGISNVNFQDRQGGCTALHFAVKLGRLDLVRALLATGGIDVNIRNHDEESPFDLATSSAHDSIAEAMIGRRLVSPHMLARYRDGLIPKKDRPPPDFALEDYQLDIMLLEQQIKERQQRPRQGQSQQRQNQQDYEMRLLLLERQNKKRLLMARQFED